MKYKVTEHLASSGTSLQGYVTASYEDLVDCFGEPQYTETSGDGKVDVEWNLKILEKEFNEVHSVTIYNWKDYDGGLECKTNPRYEWHIGGMNALVSVFLKEAFEERLWEVA